MSSQQKLSNGLLLFLCLFWFLVVAGCVWSRGGTPWIATDYNSVSASVAKKGSLLVKRMLKFMTWLYGEDAPHALWHSSGGSLEGIV